MVYLFMPSQGLTWSELHAKVLSASGVSFAPYDPGTEEEVTANPEFKCREFGLYLDEGPAWTRLHCAAYSTAGCPPFEGEEVRERVMIRDSLIRCLSLHAAVEFDMTVEYCPWLPNFFSEGNFERVKAEYSLAKVFFQIFECDEAISETDHYGLGAFQFWRGEAHQRVIAYLEDGREPRADDLAGSDPWYEERATEVVFPGAGGGEI